MHIRTMQSQHCCNVFKLMPSRRLLFSNFLVPAQDYSTRILDTDQGIWLDVPVKIIVGEFKEKNYLSQQPCDPTKSLSLILRT